MTTIGSYVDHRASAGWFTTDGLGTQHFNTHVATAAAIAYDLKEGLIGWQGSGISNDYSILNGFCPAVGGTGSLPPTTAFLHICTKGLWETIVATTATRQKASGMAYNNSKAGNYLPSDIAQGLAASTPLPAATATVTTTITAITSPGGISHPMTTLIGAS